MPTRIPNLLVNGASGIAVGMATNMPPHNLSHLRLCQRIIKVRFEVYSFLIQVIHHRFT